MFIISKNIKLCGIMFLKVLSFCGIFVASTLAAKFPTDIQKCKFAESDCIVKRMNEIFSTKSHGFPGLALPSLDPIKIDNMSIVQGGDSPVNIVLNFKDVDFSGLSKAKVYKASGFHENPQGDKLDIRLKAPRITISGPYKISGKILILPIQGSGKSNLTLDNIDITLKFLTKKSENNGKVFMQIEKMKANFETTKFQVHFSNLFNGDKALGDNMNLFLNDNWQEILREVKPSIIASFGQLFLKIVNNVFAKIPYKDMFIEQ